MPALPETPPEPSPPREPRRRAHRPRPADPHQDEVASGSVDRADPTDPRPQPPSAAVPVTLPETLPPAFADGDQPIVVTADGIALEIVRHGAAVRRLLVTSPTGSTVNVVLGHRDLSTYHGHGGYLGAIVGRLANRLRGAEVDIDGVTHQVTPNENGHALHGGFVGFDRLRWEVTTRSSNSATFALDSPDGDQGFPGYVHVEVTYTARPGAVRIDYEASTDKPTVVNLTNHAYFQLDGEGAGPVDDHRLTVAATAFTPVDADLIPTGELRRVDGTAFDLRRPTRIGDALERGESDKQMAFGLGLDHNYAIAGSGLRPVARLASAAPGGLILTVESDQPGLQVYTGGRLDGSFVGPSGRPYGPRSGIALETQGFPDAPHHRNFPSVELRPGQTYRSTTVWRFS